jgi:hypothetical protein
MGNFYTNITLRGPDLDPVLAYLDAEAIVAYVAAPQPGYVVVYDQASESQDDTILTARAAQLSHQFNCPALAVLNHDDDVLAYWLYQDGTRIDAYDSTPGWATGEDAPPTGGDAATLCRAFGVPTAAVNSVEGILRASSGVTDFPFGPDSDLTLADLIQAATSPDRLADILRRLLGVESLEEMDVDAMMQHIQSAAGRDYTFAVDRHAALVDALGLPDCTVGFGFDYLHRGETPDGLTDDDLWLTGPDG